MALDELFRYLEEQERPVVMEIDEFQQITEYHEKNTEVLLREHEQRMNMTSLSPEVTAHDAGHLH